MNPARVVNGAVVEYPYLLRPAAKQAHPEVSPLPGTWEQCTPEQLEALECVDVLATIEPALQPGETLAEGAPEFAGGEWRQTWVVEVRLPGTVSRYQIRRALRSLNRLTAFNNYIASLPADSAVREKWEQGAQQFSFGRAWCISIRDGLGLTNAQIMALWRAAETVPEDA